ncbi:DUF2530 domain-containing protein [Lapillicoccus sp.]|uniref:DUF2530 domain-containing protein n=1 Tax=Lapillicoccus sp. TaxID=1909287 RepID=UPI0025EF503D|nr:DUF2530 domain-containing protein [Lapillicoccus sp.]
MSEETRGDDGTAVPVVEELRPLALPMRRIVEVGLGLWALGLVLTLAVPALHSGERSWWPWCCVTGLVLGGIGLVYLRRGRGNAAEA